MSDNCIEIQADDRNFVLNLSREELLRNNETPVHLTKQQWHLLVYLVRNASRLIKKEELYEQHWSSAAVGDEAISQAIRNLRAALGDKQSRSFIRTEHGRGYRFVAEVREVRTIGTQPSNSANNQVALLEMNDGAGLNQLLAVQARLSNIKETMLKDAAMFNVCMAAVGQHVQNIIEKKVNPKDIDPVKTYFEGVYHAMNLFDVILENADLFPTSCVDHVTLAREQAAEAIRGDDPDTARDVLRETVTGVGDVVQRVFQDTTEAIRSYSRQQKT
jgi:DNA-binding winged helix-turn-helix (wHTH) protein